MQKAWTMKIPATTSLTDFARQILAQAADAKEDQRSTEASSTVVYGQVLKSWYTLRFNHLSYAIV